MQSPAAFGEKSARQGLFISLSALPLFNAALENQNVMVNANRWPKFTLCRWRTRHPRNPRETKREDVDAWVLGDSRRR
jgi:hypothetical protein